MTNIPFEALEHLLTLAEEYRTADNDPLNSSFVETVLAADEVRAWLVTLGRSDAPYSQVHKIVSFLGLAT